MDGMEARSVARGGSGKDGMGWQMLQGLENVSGRVRACSGVLVPALPPLPEWFVIYITTLCGRLCHACTLRVHDVSIGSSGRTRVCYKLFL